MSKYTEAISSIYFTMHNRVKPKTLGHCEDRNLEVLEELVERDTPKAPNAKHSGWRSPDGVSVLTFFEYNCPCCERRVTDIDKFCPNCGQAIDWGKAMKSEEIGILEARKTPVFTIEEVGKILECEKTLLENKKVTREVYMSQLSMINTIKKQFELAFNGKCKKL